MRFCPGKLGEGDAVTEQEVEALAGRLKRIWEPESMKWVIAPDPPVDGVEGFLYLRAVLSNLIQLSVEGYCWGADVLPAKVLVLK